MTLAELKRLVAKGESDRLEFKRSTGTRNEAARTVCAMLNGLGGYVIFGVGDKRELIGQEIGQRTVEEVTNELARIEPPAFPEVETVAFKDNRYFIVLRVPGGGGLFSYDGRFYVRVGPTTRPMPRHEHERRVMERLHATTRWENQPVPDEVTVADLDAEEIRTTLRNAIDLGRLVNPGGFHLGIEPAKLVVPHESKPWNPIIANVFYRAGVIERWGMGTLKILDWCQEFDCPQPEWKEQAGSIYVTFKPAAWFEKQRTTGQVAGEVTGEVAGEVTGEVAGEVTGEVGRLLQALAVPMTRTEMQSKLGLKGQANFRDRYLVPALEAGLIERTIPDKPQSRLQRYRLTERGRVWLAEQTKNQRPQ